MKNRRLRSTCRPVRFAHLEAPNWIELRRLLATGLPIGVTVSLEAGLFIATALLIGRMGEAVFVAIIGMVQQSVEIAAWVEMVRMTTPDPDGTSIDLDDPRTVAGLNAIEPVLVAQGIVSAGWAAGVVA